MNQWSSRRKAFVLFITILFLAVVIGLPMFFLFYQAPTCSDGKMNGDETGVDCGGSCQLLCPAESLPLLSQGDPRILELAPNIYEVVAVFENPNPTGEVERARYTLNIYGVSSEPLETIEGEAFIPKNSSFVIFEGPMEIGEVPIRATVDWLSEYLVWQKNAELEPRPSVRNTLLTREDTAPRVDAVLLNGSLDRMHNIEATALVYDASGNIIGASKTFVEELLPGQSAPIVFTWPGPFGTPSSSVDIVTRILPDTSFIR